LFPDGLAGPEVTAVLEEEQRLKEHIFAGHLRRMVRTAQAGGAQVVVTTLPWNLGTAPALSGLRTPGREDVLRMVRRVGAPGEADAEGAYREGLALDPSVAALHHQAGRMYQGRRLPGLAADAFRLAAEWDLVPDATPSINAVIRRVAEEEGATLVDLHALSDEWMAGPDTWFLDKVHVSAQGATAIGERLGPVVAAELER
jgi:lysophospholipase L1-like esterase